MRKTQVNSLMQNFAYKDNSIKPRTNNCVIYTRVSSKEQYDTNLSIDVQLKFCKSYAKQKKYTVVKTFGGTYESAKSDTERKEFTKMISYVKKAKNISYILVYTFDRFSRTGMNAGKLTEELAEKGIYVVSVTQDVNNDTPSGQLQKNIFLIFSAFDNQQRRSRTISGMQELLRRGYWTFECPRGFKDLNRHATSDKRKIVISEEGKFIQKAFQLKLQRKRTTDIAAHLEKLGYKINFRRLSEIFRNPFYAGYIVCSMIPGEIIEGKHERMVKPEDFLKINQIMNENHFGYTVKDSYPTLYLKNFIICTVCGLPMTGHKIVKKKTGKEYFYYKCRKSCRNNRKDVIVNKAFLNYLEKYQIDEKFIAPLLDMMKAYFAEFYKEKFEEIKLLKAKSKELLGKVEVVEEKFVTGEITSELYQKYKAKFLSERDEIEQGMEQYDELSSNLEVCLEKTAKLCSNLLKFWGLLNFKRKREFLELLFPKRIYFDPENNRVQTSYVNAFFALSRCFSEDCGCEKERGISEKIKDSSEVTSAGFKPATS